MWITINDKRINTDSIKEVTNGPAQIYQGSQECGRQEVRHFYNSSANGVTVVMNDGKKYTSIDNAANRNRSELRRAGIL